MRLLEWHRKRRRLKHCPHSALLGIYGDEINHCGGWRLQCVDCWRYLDGPVALAEFRWYERKLSGDTPG